MTTPTLSVIIAIRNRTGARLENCLRSLRAQSLADGKASPSEVEIILSDFGSESGPAAEIRDLAERYAARVVRVETTALWNRSAAINAALLEAKGRFSFCTDADMLFKADFLATVLDELESCPRLALVVCKCRDLPDLGPERLYDQDEYAALEGKAELRQAMGTGACQVAETRWFRSIGGFDEGYVFWGFEDKDMVHRAQRAGLELRFIHERTSMLHQWHRTTKNDRYVRKVLNKIRYYATRSIVVKRTSLNRPPAS
ncbi:MAG: glycosyltransferase [Myxococcales bacterium]|nr:glycosyltransferase [Myxococcales bacterium]